MQACSCDDYISFMNINGIVFEKKKSVSRSSTDSQPHAIILDKNWVVRTLIRRNGSCSLIEPSVSIAILIQNNILRKRSTYLHSLDYRFFLKRGSFQLRHRQFEKNSQLWCGESIHHGEVPGNRFAAFLDISYRP